MAKLAQTATGGWVKPWRPFSGDGTPLRDGAPYKFVRTIYFRVVTPLVSERRPGRGGSLPNTSIRTASQSAGLHKAPVFSGRGACFAALRGRCCQRRSVLLATCGHADRWWTRGAWHVAPAEHTQRRAANYGLATGMSSAGTAVEEFGLSVF